MAMLEYMLEQYPCAALLFDYRGKLLRFNNKAAELYEGSISLQSLSLDGLLRSIPKQQDLQSGADTATRLRISESRRFLTDLQTKSGRPRRLVCEARLVAAEHGQRHNGSHCVLVAQLDATGLSDGTNPVTETMADRSRERTVLRKIMDRMRSVSKSSLVQPGPPLGPADAPDAASADSFAPPLKNNNERDNPDYYGTREASSPHGASGMPCKGRDLEWEPVDQDAELSGTFNVVCGPPTAAGKGGSGNSLCRPTWHVPNGMTPADKMMKLLDAFMEGTTPDIHDIRSIMGVLERQEDIYKPQWDSSQLLSSGPLDEDVSRSLRATLAGPGTSAAAADGPLRSANSIDLTSNHQGLLSGGGLRVALTRILAGRPHRKLDLGSLGPRPLRARGSKSRLANETEESLDSTLSPQSPERQAGRSGEAGESLSRGMLDQVEVQLAASEAWHFDVCALDNLTGGHALSCLGYYYIMRAGLLEQLALQPVRLISFLRGVEAGYQDNPYHNARHAAAVMQVLHIIRTRGGVSAHRTDPTAALSAYVAAAVHDFQHPGVTNDFLVAARHPLALTYNDNAPLENHHLAGAFTLMASEDCDFFAADQEQYLRFRRMVIELVLRTDMKQHFSTIGMFRAHYRLASGTHNDSNSRSSAFASEMPREGASEREELLVLQMALKCADLGHTAAPLEQHKRWVRLLEEEVFRQGDREKAVGIPVGPLFDRSKPGLSKSQVGFFEIVVIPLYSAFSQVYADCEPLLAGARANCQYWADKQNADSGSHAT